MQTKSGLLTWKIATFREERKIKYDESKEAFMNTEPIARRGSIRRELGMILILFRSAVESREAETKDSENEVELKTEGF